MEVFPAPPEKEKEKEKEKRAKERSLMEGGGSGSGFNGFQGVPNAGSLPPTPAGSVEIPPPNPAAGQNNRGGGGAVREQDRFMPIANVIRIMRKVLPTHAKISDDAKETVQECVSEYISFITSEANERCQHEQRKTITAEDVLWAMRKLGFDDYVDPLTIYLHRYRELEGDHSSRGSLRAGDSQLPPLKRNASQMLQQQQQPQYDIHQYPHHQLFAPRQMAPPPPPPPFHLPPPAVTAMPLPPQGQPHTGMYGGFMGMYGSGGEDMNGASSSSQFPMPPGFDQYGGYNYK